MVGGQSRETYILCVNRRSSIHEDAREVEVLPAAGHVQNAVFVVLVIEVEKVIVRICVEIGIVLRALNLCI